MSRRKDMRQVIDDAIANDEKLEIVYSCTTHDHENVSRIVNPKEVSVIGKKNAVTVLFATQGRKDEVRSFRLDKIRSVTVVEE